MTLPASHKQFLEYVRNTGGNATIADFDDDFEPIGPKVRQQIMPTWVFETETGKLVLTDAGRAALAL